MSGKATHSGILSNVFKNESSPDNKAKVHIQHPDVEDVDSVEFHWPRFLVTCYQRQTVDIFLTIKYFASARSYKFCIGTSMSREEDPFRGNAR